MRGSATSAGRRRDAAAGDALAHIAHDRLWIRSHAVTLILRKAASNIRSFAALVNEMTIQCFSRDTRALLRNARKTDETIFDRRKLFCLPIRAGAHAVACAVAIWRMPAPSGCFRAL
jgi:hypothetical protein